MVSCVCNTLSVIRVQRDNGSIVAALLERVYDLQLIANTQLIDLQGDDNISTYEETKHRLEGAVLNIK